jgi:hypothetical protein
MIPFVIALLLMAYWELTLFLGKAWRQPGIEKRKRATAAKCRDPIN